MNNGPSLVLKGTMIGSLAVALLGWLLAVNIRILPKTEVAYAAAVPTAQNTPKAAAEPPAPAVNCSISAAYPEEIQQWCSLITRYSAQVGLPADLVAAVIWQESGGNASAYSASGAVGLMQVMPRDGLAASFECINGPCFASRPTIQELQDPSYNVEFGTRMLAGLNAKLGDLREALKAYGPMDMGYTYADRVLAIYDEYGGQDR